MWKGCKAEAKPRKQHHYQVSVPPQQGSPDTSPTKAFPFKKKKGTVSPQIMGRVTCPLGVFYTSLTGLKERGVNQ